MEVVVWVRCDSQPDVTVNRKACNGPEVQRDRPKADRNCWTVLKLPTRPPNLTSRVQGIINDCTLVTRTTRGNDNDGLPLARRLVCKLQHAPLLSWPQRAHLPTAAVSCYPFERDRYRLLLSWLTQTSTT